MPDDPAQQSQIERAIQRAFSEGGVSRRAFLGKLGRGGLVAASALSIPAILAACGIKPAATRAPLTSASIAATLSPLPSPAGTLNFANWPAYIDINDKDGSYPTIKKFEKESKIKVAYTEAINDNEEFFGKIQPDLAAGNPPAYDLIVMTRLDDRQDDPAGLPRAAAPRCPPEVHRRWRSAVQEPVVRPGQPAQPGMAVGHHRHRLQPEADRAPDHHLRRPARPEVQGPRGDVQRDARHDVDGVAGDGRQARERHDRRRARRPAPSCRRRAATGNSATSTATITTTSWPARTWR